MKENNEITDEELVKLAESHSEKASDIQMKSESAKQLASGEEISSDTNGLKGGNKMPEKMENESVKVAELETAPKVEAKVEAIELKKEPKEEPKAESKTEEKKSDKKEDDAKAEDKEEMSSEAILNKVKEMSADELVKFTEFTKAHLNANKDASAKEVYLAYEKSKAGKKELSASDLLASIDSRIAALKELDSSKTIAKMDSEIKELQAKVKTPDRKTLSIAFDRTSDSNLGMLNFLQHRIN